MPLFQNSVVVKYIKIQINKVLYSKWGNYKKLENTHEFLNKN
jgi:hypothetical protein